ncbi:MAG TPA: hypothetical protein VD995_32510 [Azospirillum sp.]|nr:hypothetical protein [Azospirillum sp.]
MSVEKQTGDEIRAKTNARIKKHRNKAAAAGLRYITVLVPEENVAELREIAKNMVAFRGRNSAKKSDEARKPGKQKGAPQPPIVDDEDDDDEDWDDDKW